MRQDCILFAFPYAGMIRIRFFEYHLSPGLSTGTPHCVKFRDKDKGKFSNFPNQNDPDPKNSIFC
jgi:hypothetical protein